MSEQLTAASTANTNVRHPRPLCVVADDYGIGPETSRGILELAMAGRISATVALINSPYAADAISMWKQNAPPADLGWHPCLTLDVPVLPARDVPSLVTASGRFHSLGQFLVRAQFGMIRGTEVRAELRAQWSRFCDLVGKPPSIVNSHQHVSVFPPVRAALQQLLQSAGQPCFVRRVREPWSVIYASGGSRLKRTVLNWYGTTQAKILEHAGFPGAESLVGVTDHAGPRDPNFFRTCLAGARASSVELMVHPGFRDETLLGRDAVSGDGNLERRESEFRQLAHPGFPDIIESLGFRLVSPSEWPEPE